MDINNVFKSISDSFKNPFATASSAALVIGSSFLAYKLLFKKKRKKRRGISKAKIMRQNAYLKGKLSSKKKY